MSSWCSFPGLSSANISASTLALLSTTSSSLCNLARCSAVRVTGAELVETGGPGWGAGAARRGDVLVAVPPVGGLGSGAEVWKT